MASSIDASTSGAGGVITTADNTGILQLKTAGTTAVTVDASQNVGIGTSSPANYGAGYKTVFLNGSTSGVLDIGTNGTRVLSSYYDTTTSAPWLTSITAVPLVFGTNGVERMRIDSSGRLLVSVTAPFIDSNNKMELSSAGSGIGVRCQGGTTATPLGLWNDATSGNNVLTYFYTEAGGTTRGSITYNRAAGLMSYNTTSDQRLKENIVDATSALDKIDSVKIRSFDWKETGNHVDFGVIAQELVEVAPECVTEGQDNEDGTIKNAWSVDTSALVPAMIKAIQEQQTIIKTQSESIDDLKARITALEGAK